MAALLMIASAGTAAYTQLTLVGSLTGKLTDLHSTPLDGVTVTLRSQVTGAETRATTSRSGVYRFSRLEAGEYTMEAESPRLGRGHLAGIVISAGNELRVQTAMAFEKPGPGPILGATAPAEPAKSASTATTAPEGLLNLPMPAQKPPIREIEKPEAVTPFIETVMTEEPLLTLPVNARIRLQSEPVAQNRGGYLGSAIVKVAAGTAQASMQVAIAQPNAEMASGRDATSPSGSTGLTSAQLQALPLAGRNWDSFVFDAPDSIASVDGEVQVSQRGGRAAEDVTVDGSSVRLAFGGSGAGRPRRQGASLIGPGASEAAIREVQTGGYASGADGRAPGSGANVESQRGAKGLHGQAFLFERQNLWGAQNPFTQWVRETAPASLMTIPVFTAQPYTPSDKETRWGAGLGGTIRRDKLFWFASLDSYQRDDPGVSAVKHPDNFFAQPSNDQMQVLSARLGLSSANPVAAGLAAYSKMLETLGGLLGPAARTSSQWAGFGRIDWTAAERHRFTLEGTGARFNSPGGGMTRTSETFGSHSFGSSLASEVWMLGRWEAFVTPNLLAVTQGSVGRQIQDAPAEQPSSYEQTLNVNAWGRLPQMNVDSRYGLILGNPARFGSGTYPDEHLYKAQEQVDWVRGGLLVKAGFELSHNTDATSRLRNQTGTYSYSSLENFASDALAFAAFGLNGQLDPMNQHNCDQTGRAWRDSTGTLHGLGYLPCYSSYSQTMGPTNWWISTDDWAGYVTSQWQPQRQLALSLAMRWEREQLPQPTAAMQNPDLPLTQRLPSLGNEWGPRASLAWGARESRWPVLRLGYGMYFGRTQNSTVETALTETGSLKGDLNFFMRPTDNLYGGGAPPFPYVLAGEPTRMVKPGAVEFAPGFRSGEVQQAEAAIEETLPGHIHLEATVVASLGRRLPVTVDANIDPAVNPKTITYAVVDGNGTGPIKTSQIKVPFFASWPTAASPTGFAGRANPNYQQVAEIVSRANSTYEAAMLRLSRTGRGLTLHVRYTYAHAMDWNPNESSQVTGSSVFDPIDFHQEYGTSSLDVRHSASTAVIWEPKWKLTNLAGRLGNGWLLSGIGQFHSGLPYTMHTAGSLAKEFDSAGTAIVALSTGMNGYGGDNRVYGVGRNTYRYPATWKADLRLSKRFNLGRMRQLELLAESFNLFNHQNVTELETVGYSIESGRVNGGMPVLNYLTGIKTGQTEFGRPLNVNATDFYRERQMQFGMRMRF